MPKMTTLQTIKDKDGHGSFERQMLEQFRPYCNLCGKPVAGWLEPKNAKQWLDVHWNKKHADTT